jgi:hypothetical protein
MLNQAEGEESGTICYLFFQQPTHSSNNDLDKNWSEEIMRILERTEEASAMTHEPSDPH